MYHINPAAERGHTRLSWLDSHHSFSFGSHYDPRKLGFGPLRVINEDRVAPGQGFHEHGHADMEIISWVLEGGLAHQDSLGTGATIRPGELQRMSAGTGIHHAEFNASATEPAHFLQIWIVPDRRGVKPGYDQRDYTAKLGGQWTLVASGDGRDNSVAINQDVSLFAARPSAGTTLDYTLAAQRRVWLQVTRGAALIHGQRLQAGDGLAIEQEPGIRVGAPEDAEWLLFDLPPANAA